MDKVTLYPTDPARVVPDLRGKPIGPEGVKVSKPFHPYYTRRVMQGDLTQKPKAPKVYEAPPPPAVFEDDEE